MVHVRCDSVFAVQHTNSALCTRLLSTGCATYRHDCVALVCCEASLNVSIGKAIAADIELAPLLGNSLGQPNDACFGLRNRKTNTLKYSHTTFASVCMWGRM